MTFIRTYKIENGYTDKYYIIYILHIYRKLAPDPFMTCNSQAPDVKIFFFNDFIVYTIADTTASCIFLYFNQFLRGENECESKIVS